MDNLTPTGSADEKWLDGISVQLEHPGILITQRLNLGCTLSKLKLEFEALLKAAETRGSELIESSLQNTIPLQKHVQAIAEQFKSVNNRLSNTVNHIKEATSKLERLERTILSLIESQAILDSIKSLLSSILFTTRHFIDICIELKDQKTDSAVSLQQHPLHYIISDTLETSASGIKTFKLSNVEYLKLIAVEIGLSKASILQLRNVYDDFLNNVLNKTKFNALVVDDELIKTSIKQASESIANLEKVSDWLVKTMLEMIEKSLNMGIINVANFGMDVQAASLNLINFINLLKCYYSLSQPNTIPSFLNIFYDTIDKCLGGSSMDSGPEEQFKSFQKFADKILTEIDSGSIRKFLDKVSTYEDTDIIASDLAIIFGNQVFRTIEQHFKYIFAPVYEEPFLKAVDTIIKLQTAIEKLSGPASIATWRGTEIPSAVSNLLCLSPLLHSLANKILESMNNLIVCDKIGSEGGLYLASSDELVNGSIEMVKSFKYFEYYPLKLRVVSDLLQLYTSHINSFIFWQNEMKESEADNDSTWPPGTTPFHAAFLISDLNLLIRMFSADGTIQSSILKCIDYPSRVYRSIDEADSNNICLEQKKSLAEFTTSLELHTISFLDEAVNSLKRLYDELVEYLSNNLAENCRITFQFIKTIPSQFRIINAIQPTMASSFISLILVPLKTFIEFSKRIDSDVLEKILSLAVKKVAIEYDTELANTIDNVAKQNENLKMKLKSDTTITTDITLVKMQFSLDAIEFINVANNLYQKEGVYLAFNEYLEPLNKWIIKTN